jgi:predicted Zn-dependent peptidase
LAEKLFGDLEPSEVPKTEPAIYKGGEQRIIKSSEQAHVFFGLPGPNFGASDYYVGHVLSALYGGGMSSRLFQEIREKRGLCYSIYSFMSSMTDTGMFGIYAGTDGSQAGQALTLAIDELKSVADGPTEAETSRAKAQLRASILMSRESTSTRAEQLAQQLIIHGRPVTPEEVRAKVDDVDRLSIANLAAKALSGAATLSLVGPVENSPSVEELTQRMVA